MAKFPVDILRMALDPLADSAQAIVRNVSDVPVDKTGALTRMADDVVDDWGWKGGKPGEITGTEVELSSRYPDKRIEAIRMFRNQLERHAATRDSGVSRNFKTLDAMFTKYPNVDEAAANIAGDFAALEDAGVPRAWTGKVLAALYDFGRERVRSPGLNLRRVGDTRYSGDIFGSGGVTGIADPAKAVSESLRPLTNSQRETFLALLPEWEGSLEDLAVAARSLT